MMILGQGHELAEAGARPGVDVVPHEVNGVADVLGVAIPRHRLHERVGVPTQRPAAQGVHVGGQRAGDRVIIATRVIATRTVIRHPALRSQLRLMPGGPAQRGDVQPGVGVEPWRPWRSVALRCSLPQQRGDVPPAS